MSLLSSSAYLRICPNCSGHAQIKLSDGQGLSDIFFSKERGEEIVEELFDFMKIDEFEREHLLWEIDGSKLPKNQEDGFDFEVEFLTAMSGFSGVCLN